MLLLYEHALASLGQQYEHNRGERPQRKMAEKELATGRILSKQEA
jgi:hypothetical protein